MPPKRGGAQTAAMFKPAHDLNAKAEGGVGEEGMQRARTYQEQQRGQTSVGMDSVGVDVSAGTQAGRKTRGAPPISTSQGLAPRGRKSEAVGASPTVNKVGEGKSDPDVVRRSQTTTGLKVSSAPDHDAGAYRRPHYKMVQGAAAG